jgi:hypothetical protein
MELTVGQKLANILRANRPIYIHVEWYQHGKKYNVSHYVQCKVVPGLMGGAFATSVRNSRVARPTGVQMGSVLAGAP